jgi:hypothetical protein
MKTRILLLSVLLFIVLAGCSASPAGPINQEAKTNAGAKTNVGVQTGSGTTKFSSLNREVGQSYEGRFVVKFSGAKPWTYTLNIRKIEALGELSLHLDGIEGANNPGDIRLVTDGQTSWITGQGTDQECIQFPNGQGLDPQWILPENLVSDQDLINILAFTGEEKISGQDSFHFSGSANEAGDWKNVKAEVWQDKSSQALLRYLLNTQVDDPFFGTGMGQLSAIYETSTPGNVSIEPVKGCEISVPLPDGVSKFVRLPGMASFESSQKLDQLQIFFQQRLPKEGWTQKDVPAINEGSVVMSYTRNGEEVEIHIAPGPNEIMQVKLLFTKTQ